MQDCKSPHSAVVIHSGLMHRQTVFDWLHYQLSQPGPDLTGGGPGAQFKNIMQ